jgi:hypothetical protein
MRKPEFRVQRATASSRSLIWECCRQDAERQFTFCGRRTAGDVKASAAQGVTAEKKISSCGRVLPKGNKARNAQTLMLPKVNIARLRSRYERRSLTDGKVE